MIALTTALTVILATTLKLLGVFTMPWFWIFMSVFLVPLFYMAILILTISAQDLVGDLGEIDRE